MAASNKPTAVHFTLIAFVLISLLLGVFLYLYYQEAKTAEAKRAQADKERGDVQRNYDDLRQKSEDLKKAIGHIYDDLGTAGAADPSTTLGALMKDLQTLGGPQFAGDNSKTLQAMRTALDNAINELQTLKNDSAALRQQLQDVLKAAGDRIQTFQTSQEGSEQQLQGQIAKTDEQLRQKDDQIKRWEDDYRTVQREKEQIRDELNRLRDQLEGQITILEKQIDFYKDQLEEATKVSFERPDGHIINVDNNTRTVWINLGSKHHLRPQTTFSVYVQDHRGIGRGAQDIKAKIEVTKILGPEMSQARILEEDLPRPIADGDPIFSPLWQAGRTEWFAAVGRIDLDEDGISDWEQFRELVENAGAKIDLHVNPEGLREPPDAKVSVRTKFLIVGDIDDPTEFPGQPEKQETIKRILAEHDALVREARLYGVRVVRLNDFLAYIGYQPQMRVYQAGQERPFNLKYGARSSEAGGSFEDRVSPGRTSELFRPKRSQTQGQPMR